MNVDKIAKRAMNGNRIKEIITDHIGCAVFTIQRELQRYYDIAGVNVRTIDVNLIIFTGEDGDLTFGFNAVNFQTIDEQPINGQPIDEQPIDEQPIDEQPIDEQPIDEQPINKEPIDEQPIVSLPFVVKSVPIVPLVPKPINSKWLTMDDDIKYFLDFLDLFLEKSDCGNTKCENVCRFYVAHCELLQRTPRVFTRTIRSILNGKTKYTVDKLGSCNVIKNYVFNKDAYILCRNLNVELKV